MVESVKLKAKGSVFSIKKDTALSDLIPRLKLCHELVFIKINEKIVERKIKEAKRKWDLSPFYTFLFFKIRRFR
jgi:hypothetical protein